MPDLCADAQKRERGAPLINKEPKGSDIQHGCTLGPRTQAKTGPIIGYSVENMKFRAEFVYFGPEMRPEMAGNCNTPDESN